MNEEIFREKNINKLSSPDELNDYIKVIILVFGLFF